MVRLIHGVLEKEISMNLIIPYRDPTQVPLVE